MVSNQDAAVIGDVDPLIGGKDSKTDGDFLICCSRKYKTDDCLGTGDSKSWLLTGKTLFPYQVTIHFEAYEVEKLRKDVKETAKCFSTLVIEFVNDGCVWQEIVSVTNALRSTEPTEEEAFLKDMFYNLPSDIQHHLLRLRASRSEDTMENCQFMLLLLTNFPTAVPKHGLELMDTLIAAEKKTMQQSPVNCYRKLLVCNLTPLLVNVDLPQKNILCLLIKSFEFYICYMTTNVTEIKDLPESESRIENPWKNLFHIYEKFSSKLNWSLSHIFSHAWTKEGAWQKITHFIHCHPDVLTSEILCREVVYGMSLLFLHSLHEYVEKIYEGNLLLVEIPPDVHNVMGSITDNSAEPPAKRPKIKSEDDIIFTPQNRRVPVGTFVCAFKCWDFFHGTEPVEREFLKLTKNLKIENWTSHFLQAVYLYKGMYNECLITSSNNELLKKNVHLITVYFWLKQYLPMLECIIETTQQLSQMGGANATTNGSSAGINQPSFNLDEDISGFGAQKVAYRHLHFLHLCKENILKYITKLMIVALKKSAEARGDSSANDGHILVFLQLNWPSEKHIFQEIIDRIKRNKRFSYHLFMTYIVNMQMLEEFMYLSSSDSNNSPGITLDIMVPTNNQLISQRRMSTRGVDKGAKEDFKLCMKRQTARSNEIIYGLIMRFITTEKDHLINAFVHT